MLAKLLMIVGGGGVLWSALQVRPDLTITSVSALVFVVGLSLGLDRLERMDAEHSPSPR